MVHPFWAGSEITARIAAPGVVSTQLSDVFDSIVLNGSFEPPAQCDHGVV
jgi:hypothetical protein